MASSPERADPSDPRSSDTGPEAETVRWPRLAWVGVGVAVLAVVGALGAAFVAAFVVDRSVDAPIVADAVDPVAPVALADGGFLYGERSTGRVIEVDRDGAVSVRAEIPDELRTDGQRGLIGLAVRAVPGGPGGDDGDVEIYATWTRADGDDVVVGRLAPGPPTVIWDGPVTSDFANGGTLAFRGDTLVVGIGELQDPDAVADPTTPNGKVLALDPSGPADQTPVVIAGGWHNPFALAVVGDVVWVVDNAPGSDPERLVRIAADGTRLTLDLDGTRAPSGLAVDADGDLVLCGFVSMRVEGIATDAVDLTPPTERDGPPCATGVAVTVDGDVVTTTTDEVWRD